MTLVLARTVTADWSSTVPGVATAHDEYTVTNTHASQVYQGVTLTVIDGQGNASLPSLEGWVEVRITPPGGSPGPWFAIASEGASLPDIAPAEVVGVDIRLLPPVGRPAASYVVAPALDQASVVEVWPPVAPSVWYPSGALELVSLGGVTPDGGGTGITISEALVSSPSGVYGVDGDTTIDTNDGAAAALGAGDEYIARVSLSALGAVTVTKGLKASVGSAVAPAWPAGELALVEVTRKTSAIVAGDLSIIDSSRDGLPAVSGSNVVAKPVRAYLGSRYLRLPSFEEISPADGSYLLSIGAAGWVFGANPAGLVVASVTVAGGTPTIDDDRRPWGAGCVVEADVSGTASTAVPLAVPAGRWWIPPGGVRVTGLAGDGEVEIRHNGASISARNLVLSSGAVSQDHWHGSPVLPGSELYTVSSTGLVARVEITLIPA